MKTIFLLFPLLPLLVTFNKQNILPGRAQEMEVKVKIEYLQSEDKSEKGS